MVYKIHKNSKFTLDDIDYILQTYGSKSSRELAKEFNVTYGTINRVIVKSGRKLLNSRRMYTTEELITEALKYSTIKEFNEKNSKMCSAARSRGVISQLRKSGHFKILGNIANKFVYVYFLTGDRVYVGQTCNIDRRHKEHLKKWLDEKSILKKTISSLLDVTKATRLEEALRQRYIKHKFIVLNKTSCTSAGSVAIKWTKEACIAESKNYTNRKQWQRISSGSYNAAWENGWLEECIPAMPAGRRVKNLDTGEIFESARAASRWLKQNKHAVSKAIHDGHLCGGYKWQFIN